MSSRDTPHSDFNSRWSPRAIKDACARDHGIYKRALEAHYEAYFAANLPLAGEHPRKAGDLASALPPGWESLGAVIPAKALHYHHLSGGSSQVLAISLLGSAIANDKTLAWLPDLLGLDSSLGSPEPRTVFEYALDRETLNEEPHVTNIDLLVDDADVHFCIEAKLWEAGLGSCRCGTGDDRDEADDSSGTSTPAQERGGCSERVLRRPLYYAAAQDVLGLPEHAVGHPCPIAAGYQGVRNIAAARALAKGRRAVFGLFFDSRNPYFGPCGDWPGWPAALSDLSAGQDLVDVRCCSWQRLLGSGAVPADVVEWAKEKHDLHPATDAQ